MDQVNSESGTRNNVVENSQDTNLSVPQGLTSTLVRLAKASDGNAG